MGVSDGDGRLLQSFGCAAEMAQCVMEEPTEPKHNSFLGSCTEVLGLALLHSIDTLGIWGFDLKLHTHTQKLSLMSQYAMANCDVLFCCYENITQLQSNYVVMQYFEC